MDILKEKKITLFTWYLLLQEEIHYRGQLPFLDVPGRFLRPCHFLGSWPPGTLSKGKKCEVGPKKLFLSHSVFQSFYISETHLKNRFTLDCWASTHLQTIFTPFFKHAFFLIHKSGTYFKKKALLSSVPVNTYLTIVFREISHS